MKKKLVELLNAEEWGYEGYESDSYYFIFSHLVREWLNEYIKIYGTQESVESALEMCKMILKLTNRDELSERQEKIFLQEALFYFPSSTESHGMIIKRRKKFAGVEEKFNGLLENEDLIKKYLEWIKSKVSIDSPPSEY